LSIFNIKEHIEVGALPSVGEIEQRQSMRGVIIICSMPYGKFQSVAFQNKQHFELLKS
jgi:hypothetical protein|tara:strand:- start:2904 stop:3077 length:174 start_codon:yes stop_codon:yes gene_type:complete